jgi:hypothetical protein
MRTSDAEIDGETNILGKVSKMLVSVKPIQGRLRRLTNKITQSHTKRSTLKPKKLNKIRTNIRVSKVFYASYIIRESLFIYKSARNSNLNGANFKFELKKKLIHILQFQ